MRDYDTSSYRADRNAARRERRQRLSWLSTYDQGLNNTYEIYIKSEKGDLTKAETCSGTRATQVALRREVRARMKLGADRVLLFINGRLTKLGIDGSKK